MTEPAKELEPFRLCTRLHLSELTGLKAATLTELLELIKTVSGSCIYHHTHRFLQQHQYLSPEPPNDFAYWVDNVLGDDRLGEKLASIDIIQYSCVQSLTGENNPGHRRVSAKISVGEQEGSLTPAPSFIS